MTILFTVYYGAVINPESLTTFKALPRCLFLVNGDGYIDWIVDDVESSDLQNVLASKGLIDIDVYVLKNGEFVMPGFVDTHTHAPQVPNIGSGQQYELLDWLENVTFPMESKFSDAEFARKTYPSVVQRFINAGTTTCCYYATIHLEATKILADVVKHQGQRAFVGKCNMNRNSPDNYRESSEEESIAATKELIAYIQSIDSDLVHPILTPRFAISCTSPLLSSLGDMLKSDPNLAIQTHISENQNEVKLTLELFSESTTYAGVYDDHGLLTERMILAHAVHLGESELQLIAVRKAGISHCPTSNFNLRSGMAKVGEMLDRGIKVGLGTDVSGGYSPSILTAVQHTSICSKMVANHSMHQSSSSNGTFANKQLPMTTLLYLATMGGAEVCNLSHKIGNLQPGKSFDALIVSVRHDAGNPAVWGFEDDFEHVPTKEELEGFLERFLFCGDDRNISKVFVQGRLVGGKSFVKGA
ncbi:Metallo-dependent hydrolase [Rickenella mellea]|uniref:Guanine deaminase n=1 Tax=Rickenella mellea TaxID=50990 RepID=A0A4Y7QIF9_9AGAM|nr:Metallo-dependent hydrolase [Rickenella mellea]